MLMENVGRSSEGRASSNPQTTITVFHCFTALENTTSLEGSDYEIESIKLPCSSMTREVVLLRAFEAGADAVLVLVCPGAPAAIWTAISAQRKGWTA